jgi:TRAP-type C4-dicarboxylate transport system permease small subunit
MSEVPGRRRYLKAVLTLFVALIVLVVAIAAYRYATPSSEADVEAAQPR